MEFKGTPGEWFFDPFKAWKVCVEIIDVARRMSPRTRVKKSQNTYVIADCGGPGSVANMQQSRYNAALIRVSPKLFRFIDSLVKTGAIHGALAEQASALLKEAATIPQTEKEMRNVQEKHKDLAANAIASSEAYAQRTAGNSTDDGTDAGNANACGNGENGIAGSV